MKYIFLIPQGVSPTPREPDAWATLSEEEQTALFVLAHRHHLTGFS